MIYDMKIKIRKNLVNFKILGLYNEQIELYLGIQNMKIIKYFI